METEATTLPQQLIKASQLLRYLKTITFASIPNQNLSGGTYTLNATASSNLGVSFAISGTNHSSIASLSGNVVTFVGGGTVTITASQAGNGTYLPATNSTQTLTIIDDTLQDQTIAWDQSLSSISFGTADINMTASASSGLPITYISSDTNVVDINGTYLKIIAQGSATVSASQGGNGQYSAAPTVTKNITVTKANQTIVAANNALILPNLTKDSGDFPFTPGAKSVIRDTNTTTGLLVTFASSNTSVISVNTAGTILTPVGGGTSTITATQAGNAGYNAATSKTFTVTVTEYSPYSNSLPNMILWLDAYDINGDGSPDTNSDFTSIGGKLQTSSWADLSGSSNSLSQSNTSIQPAKVVQSGLPGVAFGSTLANSGAYLSGAMPNNLSGNPGYTLVIAAKTNGTSGERFFHFGTAATNGNSGKLIGMGKNGGFYFNGGGEQTFSSVNFGGNVQIGVFRRKAGSIYSESEFMFNGVNQIGTAQDGNSTPNIPTSGTRDLILGAGKNSSGVVANQLGNAVVHEVMLFAGSLNDFAIRRLEGYLAYKWGSSTRLPFVHPFATSRPLFGGSQSITVASTNIPIDTSDNNKPFMSIFDSAFILEGSYATSGLDIVYETNNSSVLDVVNGKLDPVGEGAVRVTLKQPGDTHFSAAANRTFDMKIVGDRSQTITFTTVTETRIDQSLALSATASSGLNCTFSIVSGSSIASLSGNTLTFSDTGSVTVRASQPGNSVYSAAVSVDRTFLVKRPLTLIFDSIGNMARNQQFTVRAVVIDATTNKPVNVTPTYSIVSGAATISGNTVTCGNTTGSVTVRATATGSEYFTNSSTATFTVNNLQGQIITFKQGEKGGLRDLPISRKPIPIGMMATNSSNRNITFTIDSNDVVEFAGGGNSASGSNAALVFKKSFTKFDTGVDKVKITITATSPEVSGTYNAASPVVRELNIIKPSSTAFFDERRMDPRYDAVKAKFTRKLLSKAALKGLIDLDGDGSITISDAELLFDSDDYDSDGDGMSNFMERAFGGDSLSNDSKSAKPRPIMKKDGKQRLGFLRYNADSNSEGIEYIVERSTDLRT